MQRDRDGLLLVLQQLHLHIVRAERERDRRCRIHRRDIVDDLLAGGNLGAGDHLVAVGLHLVDDRAQVRHGEADVVRRRPDRAAGRLLISEEDQHVRELDDLGVVAELPDRAAERVGPELLVRRDVGCCDVMMAVDDRTIFGRQRAAPTMAMLRRRGIGRAQRALTCVSFRLLDSLVSSLWSPNPERPESRIPG